MSGYIPIDNPPGASPLPLGSPAPSMKSATSAAKTPPASKVKKVGKVGKVGKPGGKPFGKRKLTLRRRSS